VCGPGCSKKQNLSEEALHTHHFASPSNEIEKLNKQVFASANLTPNRGDYLLGPGDLLEIKVFESEKLDATVRLNSRGGVSLALLGEIELKGLTACEAEQLIEDKYKERYIKDPHVSIFVKEHYSQRVTVVGEVKNPGTYDYPSKQKLLDAIALAGGLTEKAGLIVQVRRLGDLSYGTNQTLLVNLDRLVNEGQTESNIEINGGDVIFVPEAGTFYVDGAVRKPGEYHLKKALSIDEAILVAGGCKSHADTDDVVIMRETEDGKREEIKVDLEEVMKTSKKIRIQDKDIIMVGSNFWARMLHGSYLNIGLPGLAWVGLRDSDR
jgi:polysaccharide export outer membrane protein